jgi:hypothetical protein
MRVGSPADVGGTPGQSLTRVISMLEAEGAEDDGSAKSKATRAIWADRWKYTTF